MQNNEQKFLKELDDKLWKAADKLATPRGAKMPRGDKDAIMGYLFAFEKEAAVHFSTTVRESNKIAAEHILENKALTETCDALLPMLLSGEFDFSSFRGSDVGLL